MKHMTLCAAAVSSLLLLRPVHAADGTRVTSGELTFSFGSGEIDIAGQSGFALQASVSRSGGIFTPASQCEALDCPPGTVIDLSARWVGNDLPGSASLRGQTFILGSLDGGANGDVIFSGSVVAPEFTSSGTVDVSAPFTFSGQLAYPGGAGEPDQVEPLNGAGIATLTLVTSDDGSSWQFRSATYAFQKKSS